MVKLFAILTLTLVLMTVYGIAGNASANECYIRIRSPATLEYSLENIITNRIILDVSLLEYSLADNSYIVFMLGYPPLNLYGFAIVKENNTTSFYSIRGSQNNWHLVNYNISGNTIIIINVHNKTLEYELLSNGIVVDKYTINTSLDSLELKSIVITIASPYNSRNNWIDFKKLVVTADNNIVVDLEPNNNTLTEIREESLLYPNSRNIELVCVKPTTITKTITRNYTVTPTNSTTITKTITKKETYTTTVYNTITTTIVEIMTTTTTRNTTITRTNISTTASTVTVTSLRETSYIPIIFYVVAFVFIALVLVLLTILLHRR